MSIPASANEFPPSAPPGPMGLIYNPIALRNAKNPKRTAEFAEAFSREGWVAEAGGRESLEPTLLDWQRQGLDVLVISGGDGTVQLVLDEVRKVWTDDQLPRLVLINGGTTGLVAKEGGDPRPMDALDALRRAREQEVGLEEHRLHSLSVDGRVAFNFGLGLFYRLADEYVNRGKRGALAQFNLSMSFVGSWAVNGPLARRAFEPIPARIRLDDELVEAREFTGMYVSSMESFWIFKGYEKIPMDGWRFAYVASKAVRVRTIAKAILPFLFGIGELPDEARMGLADKIIVEPTEGSLEFMADGELYTHRGPFVLEQGPAFTLLKAN